MKWDRTKRGNVNLVQQYMAAGLSPDAAVEKAYPTWPAAKKQQLAAQMSGAPKTAGYTSELAGTLANPLNWFGIAPLVSGGIALGTPTRSDEEQAEADEETWKNLLIPGVAPYHGWKRLGHILDKKDSEKPDKKEREELEKWQMTVKEDDPDIDEKGRRLTELQDDDAKEKDHVKLGAPRQPWEDYPPTKEAPSIFNTLKRFIGMNPDRSSPAWEERRRAHIRMSAIRRFAGADTPTIRGQLAGGAIGGLTAGGAAAGGTIGGLYGLLSDPGEDEEGERKSRLVRALKGIAYGGGLGAIGGLLGGAAAGVGANYGGRLGGYISSNLSKETKAGYIGTREKLAASDLAALKAQLAHLKEELGKQVKPVLGAGLGAVTGGTLGGLAGGGAAAGSTIGGLYGLLSDPGENKKGERRSRLLRALKGIVYGGGLGALGGLAGGAGAALGGLGGGYTGMRLGYNAFGERKASAMWTTNRDKEAACRVISKVTSLVKDPKKHKWLDDSGEGFGHWAGPPSVAKGDIEPKNVKAAQKPCSVKHDCDKAHPGLTHKEWKALKEQRHEIQKNAGVSREALGAILGASITGIPSAAAGGYIGRALTPRDEEEEE
jgi:hypothetical protein